MKGKLGLITDVCLPLYLAVAGDLLRVMPGSTSTYKILNRFLFGPALNWNKAETGRRQSPVTLKHHQVDSDVIQVSIFYYFAIHLFFF